MGNIIKASYLKDKNVYVVKLPHSEYMINGVPIVNHPHQESTLERIDDVRPVHSISAPEYYLYGDQRLSVDEHDQKLTQLQSKGTYCEYIWSFNNVEDEIEYLRFCRNIRCVSKLHTVVGDPIVFDTTSGVLETGNPFIKSLFAINTSSECNVYRYNRTGALKQITQNVFNELNMRFVEGIDYGKTKNDPVWGWSTNGIEYTVAFGSYIFREQFIKPEVIRGELDALQKHYDADVKYINDYLKAKYAATFLKSELDVDSFNFGEFVAYLQSIKNQTHHLEVKQVSSTKKTVLIHTINDAIEKITHWLAKHTEGKNSNEK